MSGDKALTDAAQARKRRKLHLSKQRADDSSSVASSCNDGVGGDDDDPEYYASSSEHDHPRLPSIRGIKRQARYDPGVPMNREELKAWRKEARRVRNRESAAASRKRTRDRIEELEDHIQTIESRYAAALQRIVELEAAAADTLQQKKESSLLISSTTTTASTAPTTTSTVSPSTSAAPSPQLSPSEVSPVASPRSSFVLHSEEELSLPLLSSTSYHQYVTDPRPNA